MRRWKKGLFLVYLSAKTVSRKPPPQITPPVLLLHLSSPFPTTALRLASYSPSSCLAATETLNSPSKCWNCETSSSYWRTSPFLVWDSCLSMHPVDDSVSSSSSIPVRSLALTWLIQNRLQLSCQMLMWWTFYYLTGLVWDAAKLHVPGGPISDPTYIVSTNNSLLRLFHK